MNSSNTNSITITPDILIIGGGSAGIAAAVAAAEAKANVVLLEKNTFLGGKATAVYVGTVCGLYYRRDTSDTKFVVNGFPRIFAEKLQTLSNSKPFFYKNGLHFLPYDHFAFIQLCNDLMQQNKINVYLNAHLTQITKNENYIEKVCTIIHNHIFIFYPKIVIDTTGESTVSHITGLDIIENKTYQAAAQIFTMTGIATSDEQTLNLSLLHSIRKGIDNGWYPKDYEMLSIIPGSLRLGRAAFKLGLPMEIENIPLQITRLELFAKTAVAEIVCYLINHHDLFKNALLAMIAPEVGIRTGPRNIGKIILQKADVMECRKMKDTVARGVWPIEFWEPGKKPRLEYFSLNDHYDIPGRALQSATIPNLFFAGRNLSASEEAVASARVIGTCLTTGYAAGRLAVGYINKESYDATVKTIQQLLFLE